jgi:Fe-S cluster assembly protein SufD
VNAFDESALNALLARRDEPAWLSERRRAAFEAFRSAAWPSLRDEEWRRTDIRALKLADFSTPAGSEPSATAAASLNPAWDLLASHYAAGLMQVDGAAARRSPTERLPDGVIFTDLATAAREHPELLRRHLLTTAVDPHTDLFTALHAAFWTSGALLYVPKGVQLDAPLFHLIGLASTGSVDFSHTLVILEEGASASLVQETASAPDRSQPGLHVGAVELIVGPSAHLRFVNIQNWDERVWHFSRERAVVHRDATLQWTVGGLGGRLAKVNQEVALAEQGAQAQVNGVMFTTGRQNLTYLTRQDHQAPHTTSDLLYKAGLKDQSRVVWKGMIRVEPHAQKTDAYQKNDNLILDEAARADSIPGLEIEANDVRCTHGATAGPVDPDMIFYLTSRGISRETAIRLIVEGFFANVYDRITLEPVRLTLEKAVAAKLGTGA